MDNFRNVGGRNTFYKFFFGFLTVIFISLILIFLATIVENNSPDIRPENIAGECEIGDEKC